MHEYLQKLMDQRQMRSNYNQMMQQALKDPQVQTFLNENADALASDAIEKGAAKIYEFVSERDKIAAGQQPFAPGYRPQLLVSNRLIDITYVPTEAKVAADEAREEANLVTAINMPKSIANASLRTYDFTNRTQALLMANDFYLAQISDPKAFHQGLFLTGPFGVGKTYLLGAIANDLAKQGQATTLLHYPTFTVDMKNAIGQNQVTPMLNRVKNAPILMLDDIGAESISPWIRDDVLGVILQYRMQEELPTFFSSNKTMDELAGFLAGNDRGDDEAVKAQRIMQRIRFLSQEVVVGGENRRLGNQ
ncbi:primosomal protein DnaI [Lacticaseibacillus brantae DSM 23927]|uniref:Primosomal protein DnaI n=2 Tax=Lacticaseibacillus brantae TaxID=943673 RepID=A0A0R2BB76_9LACO|nr:primosomal protein DnaI [Lacticaseibacillus brantae DSM 23927]